MPAFSRAFTQIRLLLLYRERDVNHAPLQ